MTDIAIRVLGGLPAIARVNHYSPYVPATWWDPPEGPELDWELRDARERYIQLLLAYSDRVMERDPVWQAIRCLAPHFDIEASYL